MSEAVWNAYADVQPESVGPYEWQIPSRACKNMVVRVLANMRERSAGYRTAISPAFDYWDGYNLLVPHGTMWRPAPEGTTLKNHEIPLVRIEGLEPVPCPFCHKTPRVKGVHRYGGGIIIGSEAHQYNTWWFECCGWAKTPHLSDPREIEKARRAALGCRP